MNAIFGTRWRFSVFEMCILGDNTAIFDSEVSILGGEAG
jgi:hypothetical protein